jgi:hypothetical protein
LLARTGGEHGRVSRSSGAGGQMVGVNAGRSVTRVRIPRASSAARRCPPRAGPPRAGAPQTVPPRTAGALAAPAARD